MSNPTSRFEEVYADHSALILAYAARRTASGQDAADVVAETFLVVWRRIDEAPEGEQVRPWLYGVARGVLSNHHRGIRRRSLLSERLARQVATLVEDAGRSSGSPTSSEVSRALGSLPADDRELLLLVGWDGLSPREAAAVLGCSTGTARVRLHRARRRFDAQLRLSGVQRQGVGGHEQQQREPTRADLKEA